MFEFLQALKAAVSDHDSQIESMKSKMDFMNGNIVELQESLKAQAEEIKVLKVLNQIRENEGIVQVAAGPTFWNRMVRRFQLRWRRKNGFPRFLGRTECSGCLSTCFRGIECFADLLLSLRVCKSFFVSFPRRSTWFTGLYVYSGWQWAHP